MRSHLTQILAGLLLLVSTPARAQVPPSPQERSRCQQVKLEGQPRGRRVQGTELWGITLVTAYQDSSGLFQQVELSSIRHPTLPVQGATLQGTALLPSLRRAAGGSAAPAAPEQIVGAALVGVDGAGQKVDLAICGLERDARDREIVWYDLHYWDVAKRAWLNPCVATDKMKYPRAMALSGVWDLGASRRDTATAFTLACETGALAKCAVWGYKPWATRNGQKLADHHQACTRMARADYCGDGKSHTLDETIIDVYDGLGILRPGRAAANKKFEAAWVPEGAYCLGRTRFDQPVEEILKECPDRLTRGPQEDLGQGDGCAIRRVQRSWKAPLLRNRSYLEGRAP